MPYIKTPWNIQNLQNKLQVLMMRTKKKQKNKELPITGFNNTEDRSIFKLKDLPLLSFYCLDTKKKNLI